MADLACSRVFSHPSTARPPRDRAIESGQEQSPQIVPSRMADQPSRTISRTKTRAATESAGRSIEMTLPDASGRPRKAGAIAAMVYREADVAAESTSREFWISFARVRVQVVTSGDRFEGLIAACAVRRLGTSAPL
jgi:hypothetical protein